MSAYLDKDTDAAFVSAGVTLTDNLILRASAIIDGYCKREIGVKSYTERVPLTEYQRGHLSYYPVLEITALKGRASRHITGLDFGPPAFDDISDLSTLDVDKNIGSLWCGTSVFGIPFTELEVTYTSGWADTPEKVKVACGMIIDQLVSINNPNVKVKKDFDSTIEYFGNSLISPEIANLLSEYVLILFR
jgi:hypothetical protein